LNKLTSSYFDFAYFKPVHAPVGDVPYGSGNDQAQDQQSAKSDKMASKHE